MKFNDFFFIFSFCLLILFFDRVVVNTPHFSIAKIHHIADVISRKVLTAQFFDNLRS